MPQAQPPPDPDATQAVPSIPPRPARPPRSLAEPSGRPIAMGGSTRNRTWMVVGLAGLLGAALWSWIAGRWAFEAHQRAEALDAEVRELRAAKLAAEERAFAAERARDAAIAVQEQAVRPRAGVFLVDLGPVRVRRDGSEPELEVPLPLEGPPVVLLLEAPGRGLEAGYSVEIYDARDRRVWVRERLTRDPLGRISVLLPERSLEFGRYEVVLRRLRAGEREELGRWRIQVVSGL